MTRKQRLQKELISQDMISKFTKNLEHISASFANPQDKSLALWELKHPMLFLVQFRHIETGLH